MRVHPAGRCLRPRRVPRNYIGPLRGRAGFWYGKDRGGPPCENLGMRPRTRVKHFGCLSPKGEFPKCTEDDRACSNGVFSGCPSLGHLSWARKKGDKDTDNLLQYSTSLPDYEYPLPSIITAREGRSSRRSGFAHRCGHPAAGMRSPPRRRRGPLICDDGSRSQWRGCPLPK